MMLLKHTMLKRYGRSGGYLCSQCWQTVCQLLTYDMLGMDIEKKAYLLSLLKAYASSPSSWYVPINTLISFNLFSSSVYCLSLRFFLAGKDAIIKKGWTLSLPTFSVSFLPFFNNSLHSIQISCWERSLHRSVIHSNTFL